MEPTAAIVAVATIVGIIVGGGVALLLRRRSAPAIDAPGELTRLSVQLEEREREVEQVRYERDAARQERDSARRELVTAQTELAAVKADHRARTEELAAARAQLDNQFKGLAAGVLKESTETLLKQAREQFDSQRQLTAAELEQRTEAIDSLVGPIRESLEKLGQRTGEIEKERTGAYERLTTQVASLQKVAGSLSEALRSPNIRGQWAEQELGNILELAGLQQHIDYYPQHTVPVPGSVARPDAVVSVPGGLKVVIDAKAPLENYLKAHEADDTRRELALLTNHATAISRHAKELSERDYDAAVAGSPDFVLMFVPADPILDAAMKVQPTLWEQAWREHRVLIATPGLLLAFLRTVALAWQQQDMQKNAQEIADLGKELYGRLRTFAEHMHGVGKGLDQALTAYNKGVGSLESRVLPQARRFEDLGAVSDARRIPELAPVETTVRAMSGQETAPATEADIPPGSVLPHKRSA
ncbi:MAG: DNA recombination protein RmuC [Acidimicrobiia bacterium]|nr:DNA recombination protein RmuC [Acidimicrobiia bacterium]